MVHRRLAVCVSFRRTSTAVTAFSAVGVAAAESKQGRLASAVAAGDEVRDSAAIAGSAVAAKSKASFAASATVSAATRAVAAAVVPTDSWARLGHHSFAGRPRRRSGIVAGRRWGQPGVADL